MLLAVVWFSIEEESLIATEEVVSLRNEAMAAQQQRLELARFKIICIAVLGSVAIGSSGLSIGSTSSNSGSVPYIIGLIPLVAIYIDVICETKKIQFMAIGSFMKTLPKGSVLSNYEKFTDKHRDTFLKNYSYQYSTIVVSAAIAIIGIGRLLFQTFDTSYSPNVLLAVVEIGSGMIGVITSTLLNKLVAKKVDKFKNVFDSGL